MPFPKRFPALKVVVFGLSLRSLVLADAFLDLVQASTESVNVFLDLVKAFRVSVGAFRDSTKAFTEAAKTFNGLKEHVHKVETSTQKGLI